MTTRQKLTRALDESERVTRGLERQAREVNAALSTGDAYREWMEEWREKQARVYNLAQIEMDVDSWNDVDYQDN